MYHSWLADINERRDFYQDIATYQGFFSNPEAARSIWQSQGIDVGGGAGTKRFSTSDEDFNEMMSELEKEAEESQAKRQ